MALVKLNGTQTTQSLISKRKAQEGYTRRNMWKEMWEKSNQNALYTCMKLLKKKNKFNLKFSL